VLHVLVLDRFREAEGDASKISGGHGSYANMFTRTCFAHANPD
jgi:hypothetical protein